MLTRLQAPLLMALIAACNLALAQNTGAPTTGIGATSMGTGVTTPTGITGTGMGIDNVPATGSFTAGPETAQPSLEFDTKLSRDRLQLLKALIEESRFDEDEIDFEIERQADFGLNRSVDSLRVDPRLNQSFEEVRSDFLSATSR